MKKYKLEEVSSNQKLIVSKDVINWLDMHDKCVDKTNTYYKVGDITYRRIKNEE